MNLINQFAQKLLESNKKINECLVYIYDWWLWIFHNGKVQLPTFFSSNKGQQVKMISWNSRGIHCKNASRRKRGSACLKREKSSMKMGKEGEGDMFDMRTGRSLPHKQAYHFAINAFLVQIVFFNNGDTRAVLLD